VSTENGNRLSEGNRGGSIPCDSDGRAVERSTAAPLAESEELRLENQVLRQRLEIQHLRRLVDDQTANARTWRAMYDEAIRRLGMFYPLLAEITEEDAFRLWELEVR